MAPRGPWPLTRFDFDVFCRVSFVGAKFAFAKIYGSRNWPFSEQIVIICHRQVGKSFVSAVIGSGNLLGERRYLDEFKSS